MPLPAFSRPATELIAERFSCRVFDTPDSGAFAAFETLVSFARSLGPGPLGGRPRFELIASESGDSSALKGLGTYGFIKNPSAFLAAIQPAGVEIADLGWATELAVLKATELGLGSCWLGGTLRRGRFAKAAKLARGESLAIVVALGRPQPGAAEGVIRRRVAGDTRKGWTEIFFDGGLERPIDSPAGLASLGSGEWTRALEALRLSPSASNKQPWALMKKDGAWELYLRRTPGYRSGLAWLMGIADMQLNDMGIAMVHLSLAAAELGLGGAWTPAPGLRESASGARSADAAAPVLVGTFR